MPGSPTLALFIRTYRPAESQTRTMGAGKERATTAHAPVIGAELFYWRRSGGSLPFTPVKVLFFLEGNSEVPIHSCL